MASARFVSPYIVGTPVPVDFFFGRNNQLAQFFNMLRGSVLQPLRVLGFRRSGKTSFLFKVADRDVIQAHLPDLQDQTFIAYVDLQAGVKSPNNFYRQVAKSIARAINGNSSPQIPSAFPEFESFSQWLEETLTPHANFRVVVLLDEFEKLVWPLAFAPDFFDGLRSLVSTILPRHLTWVTASYLDLHDLEPQIGRDSESSEFFNIFHPTPIILGGMEPAEAAQLICKPVANMGMSISPEEVEGIRHIAGTMPYFLQATAEQWLILRSSNQPRKDCEREVLESLLGIASQLPDQMRRYCRRLTNEERAFLIRVAQAESNTKTNLAVERKLLRYGLLSEENGQIQVSGEVVRQWMKNNLPYLTAAPSYKEHESPGNSSTAERSGGVNITAHTVNIGGDVAGRDKREANRNTDAPS
jgi:hypothetical protein